MAVRGIVDAKKRGKSMSDPKRPEIEDVQSLPMEIAEQKAPQSEFSEKPPDHRWREILFWAYIVLALAGSAVLSLLAFQTPFLPFDPPITLALQSYNPAWFSTLMTITSWPGYVPQAAVLLVVIVAVIYFLGYRWEAVMALISAVSAEALDVIVKTLVHQPRPKPDLVHVVRILKTYSFPSGHVMFFMGFYAFLWVLSYKVLRPSLLRAFLLVLFGAMVSLVGISRIYLGEHWFSDVLGAYVLGSVVLLLMIRIYNWGKPKYFKDKG